MKDIATMINTKSVINYVNILWKKGAVHIFIGSFLTKFVAFFGSIFLVRVLEKSSYGILSYIENIYGYIYIFAGMGLGNALLRYVIIAKDKDEKYNYFKYSITRGSTFNIILVIIVIISSHYYPHPEEFKSVQTLLMIFILVLPFQFLVDSNTLTYRAMLANKRYAVTAFLATTLLIIGRYVGARLYDVYGVIIAVIIINLFLGVLLSIITYNKYFKGGYSVDLTKKERKNVNYYSIQYMITNGIWAIFMLNDIFLLSRLIGDPTVVADYKVAYVLPGNLSVLSTAIGIFIGPYFIKHELDHIWVWNNYKKVILSVMGIIIPIVIILLVFPKMVITFLYGKQYNNIVTLMRLLLISGFINSACRYPTAYILSSMGQIKYNMIVSFAGVILQISLNIMLIPVYGAIGAAVTSIIVYFLMAVILFIIFARKYRYKIK